MAELVAKAIDRLDSCSCEGDLGCFKCIANPRADEISSKQANSDDESKFTAKLIPSEGKLDLNVDFYQRGLFHPGAYHSEGHQDGMGLCLYLALMKQEFGDNFRLVVLDDVVMSVDRQHRKKLCYLLKNSFPNTQFIITTHELTWFRQMQSAGLINRKSGVTFSSLLISNCQDRNPENGTVAVKRRRRRPKLLSVAADN